MSTVYEAGRDVPVLTETDVLVVGGGPAGIAAAVASAREGVKTLLVERYGFLGGNITQAMVESIAWYRHEGTVEAGGIGAEFEREAEEVGGTRDDSESIGQLIDADLFKYAADRMIQKAGVTPLLHCWVVDAIFDGNEMRGVITESKSGRQAILAKIVIDASGDADVAALAGAPYHQAPKDKLMSVTVGFGLSGVDVEAFRAHVKQKPGRIGDWATKTAKKENELFSAYFTDVFRDAREAGDIPKDMMLDGYWHALTDAGEATGMNLVRIFNVDPTNVWDLTRAEIEGRRQVIYAVEALRKHQSGFENAKLRTIGSSIGTRESRKIEGRYNLTEHDVMNQAAFDDSIGIFPEFLDAYGLVLIPTTGRYFQVPYGISVPKGVENLLVAGRSVAGDRISHSATRQMMCCAVTGQACGVAAAVSVKEGYRPSVVDISTVQQRLQLQGVRIN